MNERKYTFSWDLIGDTQLGRPHLGPQVRIEIYRLMQSMFRDVLEEQFGTERTDALFYQVGHKAGQAFYRQFFHQIEDFSSFLAQLHSSFQELGIGIVRLESADMEKKSFVLTVSEDIDCSGLPELDYEICVYDEGFIAGLMESFTGQKFEVKEIDCWCTGDRTCRFKARPFND